MWPLGGGDDAPRKRRPCRRGWTGTFGSARHRSARIIPCYCAGHWRSWWDFGSGGLGDFGCHYMDLPFWALKLRHPTMRRGRGAEGAPGKRTAPGLIVRYEFPARENLPPVKMTWYDGGKRPSFLAERQDSGSGEPPCCFVGDKGMLIADYGRHQLLPEAQYAGFKRPRADDPQFDRPSRRMDPGVQDGRAQPPATSITPARWPRRSCWATWPSGSARSSMGRGTTEGRQLPRG